MHIALYSDQPKPPLDIGSEAKRTKEKAKEKKLNLSRNWTANRNVKLFLFFILLSL